MKTKETPKKLTVFLDCGDTLVDESTEIRVGDVVVKADLIPTAKKMMLKLKKKGYRICLMADGLHQSFKNILTQHDIWDLFDAYITSEAVNACKPNKRMFLTGLAAMGLTEADLKNVVMVGNNLARDIKGANELGMISVHLAWTPRYSKVPADSTEQPMYSINYPIDLVDLLDKINEQL